MEAADGPQTEIGDEIIGAQRREAVARSVEIGAVLHEGDVAHRAGQQKALSGVGGQGDSGVATRLFGTLLTWLSDRPSDCFFVGTCNDVSKLPPEFSRAERFDGVFFLDLPTAPEKDAIWALYRARYGVPESQARPETPPGRGPR